MEFKRGDYVLVKNFAEGKWNKRVYLTTIEGCRFPHYCVDECDSIDQKGFFTPIAWQYIKPCLPEFKKDQPLIVWSDNPHSYQIHRREHFFKWSDDGKPICFSNGQTSFSSKTNTFTKWDHWRLPTEEEMEACI